MLWKTLKAFVQALLLSAVGFVAIHYGADPTPVTFAVLGGIIAVFVGELKEAEIAGLVTLTFRDGEED